MNIKWYPILGLSICCLSAYIMVKAIHYVWMLFAFHFIF
jgi:hypothetical protein